MKKILGLSALALVILTVVCAAAYFAARKGAGPADEHGKKPVEEKAPAVAEGAETKPLPPPAPAAAQARQAWDSVSAPMSAENIKAGGYEGKNGGFLPVINAVGAIENAIPTAVRILNEKSAIFPTASDRILFRPVDGSLVANGAIYELRRMDDGSFTVSIPVEPLAFRSLPVEELEAAAMAEALLTARNGSFGDAPDFFKKGVAMYFSGLSPYVEKREILKALHEDDKIYYDLRRDGTPPLLNGCLAVRFLVNGTGSDLLRPILSGMDSGTSLPDAAEQAAGKSAAELQRSYEQYARNLVAAMTANRPLFKNAVSALRQLRDEDADKLLDEFIHDHPTDIFAGEALYYSGYAKYRLGRCDTAETIFTQLLLNRPFDTISHGKAHYFLGRCYEIRGFRSLAEEEYRYCRLEKNDLLDKAADTRLKEMEK